MKACINTLILLIIFFLSAELRAQEIITNDKQLTVLIGVNHFDEGTGPQLEALYDHPVNNWLSITSGISHSSQSNNLDNRIISVTDAGSLFNSISISQSLTRLGHMAKK